MKIKRVLALVLALLLCVSVFAGCSGSESGSSSKADDTSSAANDDPLYGEDNVTLKVWAPAEAQAVFQKSCDAFIAKYPDKKIKIEVVAQGENDSATNLLGDPEAAADVLGIASDQLDKCLRADALAPVYEGAIESVKSENAQGAVDAATVDGTLYAYPETGDNGYYLVYDKRVVSDEQAKTLEGVFEACKAAGKKVVINAGNGYYACMFTFTGGMKLDGMDGTTQKFNDYNKDEVVASMEAFAKLFHQYDGTLLDVEVTKIAGGFAVDPTTIGAGIDGSWDGSVVAKALGENLGAVKLPTININGTDTQIISMHGYKFLVVNKKTKFPITSQLLAQYLSGEEAQQLRADGLGWGPSNKKVAESDTVKNNAVTSAVLEQAEYSVPQVNVSQTFWDPFKTLGTKLYGEKNKYDKDTLTKLLDETVENVLDK